MGRQSMTKDNQKSINKQSQMEESVDVLHIEEKPNGGNPPCQPTTN